MPSIGLLAFSRIVDDPRVRRQGDLFHRAGWTVWGIGIPGGLSANPEWQVLGNENRTPSETWQPLSGAVGPAKGLAGIWRHHVPSPLKKTLSPLATFLRRLGILRRYWKGKASLEAALQTYWSFPHFQALYEDARKLKPDLWLANDWNTLPIAARLARETGVPYVYDTHEFAISEYEERFIWRVFQKPFIREIEAALIRDARSISSVSPGISEALKVQYDLADLPMTVLNAPIYEETPFRPVSGPVRVLYHGAVSVGRGLEETIRSVPAWRDGRTLTIRGPSDPSYRASLEALIREQGLEARVTLAPPVPMTDMVRAAREFDIGILALPNHSKHNAFALPNKLFEYAMAGLALCMTDLPEMARLIREHGLGVTIDTVSAKSIADAINALSVEDIETCKRNSLKAAKLLSWDEAGKSIISTYSRVIGI